MPVLRATLIFALAIWPLARNAVSAQQVAAGMYAESANDETMHLMPRVRVSAPIAQTTEVGAAYALDVISHASIDIRSTSLRVVDTRQQLLDAGASHRFAGWSLGGRYRLTTQPDYTSHTGVLSFETDLAEGSAVAALTPYLRLNDIGRSGESTFSRSSRMFGVRAGLKQLLDRKSYAQLVYEVQYAGGYLSNPEGFVGAGERSNTDFGCASVIVCVPEHKPDSRLQHAFLLVLRRALSQTISIGLGYRFYLDDWSMMSHTLEPDVAWAPLDGMLLRLRYRGYFQSGAEFFARSFAQLPERDFSWDPRVSPLHTHRLGLDFDNTWRLSNPGPQLHLGASVGLRFYSYRDFGESARRSLDGTLWAMLAF